MGAPPETGGGKADPERLRAALSGAAFPHLRAALSHLVDADLDARFHHGLQRIVSGLAAELDSEPRGKASPARSRPRPGASRLLSKRRG